MKKLLIIAVGLCVGFGLGQVYNNKFAKDTTKAVIKTVEKATNSVQKELAKAKDNLASNFLEK